MAKKYLDTPCRQCVYKELLVRMKEMRLKLESFSGADLCLRYVAELHPFLPGRFVSDLARIASAKVMVGDANGARRLVAQLRIIRDLLSGHGFTGDASSSSILVADYAFTQRVSRELAITKSMMILFDSHLHQKISVQDVGRTVFLHPGYACRVFRRVVGLPPLSYVVLLRVTTALSAVVATQRSLDHIALDTGFCDAAHLTHTFRRLGLATPSWFRKQLRLSKLNLREVKCYA